MVNPGIDEAATLAAIERIGQIEWQRDTARLGSQEVLMREYLRRSAVVAEALGSTLNWPWDDAAAYLRLPGVDPDLLPGYVFLDPEPKYAGPEADPLEDNIIALKSRVNTSGQIKSSYAWNSCLWYIRWEAIKKHPALQALNLPDLYDPLITFHERGGWFRPEQGYLDLDGYNLSFSSRYCAETAEEPPLAVTPAALDEKDQAARLVSLYRRVLEQAQVPSTVIHMTFGGQYTPQRNTEPPLDTYGFVPALLPLWAGRGAMYTGYWKHWFSTRQMTVVEVTVENGGVHEIARTPHQLFCEIVLSAMGDAGGMTDNIRGFGRRVGLSPAEMEQIERIWNEWGSEREGLLEMAPFSANPPLACLDGEEDYSRYTGDFPYDGKPLDEAALRYMCSFEVNSEQLPVLAALPYAPPWFPAALQEPASGTDSPQEPVFNHCLAQKDFSGAWLSLNSSGWTFLTAKAALHRLAEESKAPGSDLLATAWSAVPHEKNGRTPQSAGY